MTENTEGRPLTDEQEASGSAMPAMPSGGSEASSSQPISLDVGQQILDRLDRVESAVSEDRLSDLVDARVKSDKDTRFNRVNKEISDIRTIVEESGGDFSKVEGQLTINELMHRIDVLESGQGMAPGGGGALSGDWQEAQVETDIILMAAGWDPKDPRYEAFRAKYANKVSPEKWPGMVQTLVDKMGKQAAVNPAAVVAEGVGVAPTSDSEASLQKEYEERLAEIRQGDVRAIANLKQEFRKRGLAVW